MISEVRRTAPIYIDLFQARLQNILEKFSIEVVVDIGANRGNYASMLRDIGFKGKILSFEPLQSVFNYLEERSRSDDDWHVFNFALGPADSIKEFNISEWSEFSSFCETNENCRNHFGGHAVHEYKTTVLVRMLEDVLEEKKIISDKIFIKLDTQGYDIEAFRGIGKFLNSVCALQTEVCLVPIYQSMPTIDESISFFEEKGFMVAGLYPVSQNEQSLVIYEFDCLMVKSSGDFITLNGVDDVVPFCLDLLENNQ